MTSIIRSNNNSNVWRQESLLTVKGTENKLTKKRGLSDGIINRWMLLWKQYVEKVHMKATPLDRAWTFVEFLENEA